MFMALNKMTSFARLSFGIISACDFHQFMRLTDLISKLAAYMAGMDFIVTLDLISHVLSIASFNILLTDYTHFLP